MRLLVILVSVLFAQGAYSDVFEWGGATFVYDADTGKQTHQLHWGGELESGVLALDFHYSDIIFAANTTIEFYTDGSVRKGTAKEDFYYNGLIFSEGFVEFNYSGELVNGRLNGGQTVLNSNLVLPAGQPFAAVFGSDFRLRSLERGGEYRLLGRTVTGSVSLNFDQSQNLYRVRLATVSRPQLIGSIVVSWRRNTGIPDQVLSVLAPPLSSVVFDANGPLSQTGQTYADIWTMNGPFLIGTANFGSNPVVYVRDGRVISVQIKQNLEIYGVRYGANSLINLASPGLNIVAR